MVSLFLFVLDVDAMGNGQAGYDLFCNPNGIQGDIFTTVNNGEDDSPDWVWESAGKITDEGYQVEIKLPLKSIRFKSGKTVVMGLLFWRRISRLGVSGSWPEIKPGVGSFNILAKTTFMELEAVRKLEVLPSLTFSSGRDKDGPGQWEDFAGGTNQVIGSDLKFRLGRSHQTSLTYLNSYSKGPDEVDSLSGNMFAIVYDYYTKPLGIFAAFEHYGINFRMDSAFYNRTGFNQGMFYIGPTFAPKSKKLSWVKKVNPFFYTVALHDLKTRMEDILILFGLRFNFTKQAWFRTDYIFYNESWVDETFHQKIFRIDGGVQLFKWLRLAGNLSLGDGIYYDEEDPYMGRSNSFGFTF